MRITWPLPACALALVVPLVVAPQASAAVRTATRPSPVVSVAAPPESPSARAARTGTPVEVTAERSATTTTFANPDGTYTLETSSAPTHGRTADGTWQDI